MWNLPVNASYVNQRTYPHPVDRQDVGRWYWRLVRFTSGRYAMLGMAGEVRTCSQAWARSEAAASASG